MGLKALVTCCVVIGYSLMASAQQSKITFKTDPMNAKLILDGEEMGDANGRKIKVGFNERKGIVQHVFVVKAAGYEDKDVTFDLDTPARKNKHRQAGAYFAPPLISKRPFSLTWR